MLLEKFHVVALYGNNSDWHMGGTTTLSAICDARGNCLRVMDGNVPFSRKLGSSSDHLMTLGKLRVPAS